jgi:glycerol-3-phosphate acyltransferase PlsY
VSLQAALLLVGAYILGAIPFGVLITRAQAGVDITKLGSGNIGATNVLRTLGWRAALPVMVFDIGKGLIPPLIARVLNLTFDSRFSVVDFALIAGFAAVLGHCASPFLKFKGGKGVATICGAAIGATPMIAVVGISAFVLVTAITRYISLASIVAVLVAVVTAIVLRFDGLVIAAYSLISLFIIYKHRSNIGRLMKGEESTFNFRGGGANAPRSDESKSKETEPEESPVAEEQSTIENGSEGDTSN